MGKGTYLLFGLCASLLLCAVVDSQSYQHNAGRGEHVYTDEQGNTFVHRKKPSKAAADTRDQQSQGGSGPTIIGPPDSQVYIRGGNEGTYTVPGVDGVFQHSPSRGQHTYTDGQGTNYQHGQQGAGGASTHSISGPGINAYNSRRARSPDPQGFLVERPGRTVISNGRDFVVHRQSRSPDVLVHRPGHTVYSSGGSHVVSRQSRSPDLLVQRPGRTVVSNGAGDLHVSRPGQSVDISGDHVSFQRHGRSLNDDFNHKRFRRARVQGENFVARDNQAGVWNENVSVWKRPDGRTVTVDRNGNVITSGSPNGRGPQHYSG